MKQVLGIGVLAIVSLVLAVGCDLNPAAAGNTLFSNMPDSVQVVSVPGNMKGTGSTALKVAPANITGWAYSYMKGFNDLGLAATSGVDTILSNIKVNSNFFATNLSKKVVLGNGSWVYLSTNGASNYFVYYGTNVAFTNFYMDWEMPLIGKAVVWFAGANVAASEGIVYFDKTASPAKVDIYLKMVAGKSEYEKFHLLIEGSGTDGAVTYGIGVLTNAITNSVSNKNTLKYWDLVGYGTPSTGGGVYAWANSVFTNLPSTNSAIVSSIVYYDYNEMFDSTGGLTYKLGIFNVPGGLGTSQTYFTNTDTGAIYTNEAKNATVEAALSGNTNRRLTSADYPTLSLIPIP